MTATRATPGVPSSVVARSAADVVPRRLPARTIRRRRVRTATAHALLIGFALLFMLPMVFVVLSSLMSNDQVLSAEFWPRPFQWDNYPSVWNTIPLWRYGWNTVQIAVLATVGIVVSSIPVAYALARMRWKGRQVVFVIVLSTLMLPYQVTVVPLYVWFSKIHWIPSFKPLIVPAFLGDAFSIFLLRQFFMSVPEDLADAARVDGASHWQIMTRIMVPLSKSAIAAIALFNFLYNWNDFFGPLLFAGDDPHLWTLALGLNEFRGQHHVEYNLIMAASVMFMIPVIVLFFLAQRVFIEGVTLTGSKE
ncbi:MAG TPA: carbohydrate ABC transporter permease [Actinomycetota bacterium]|nr:carbohydrate ABC transporter permease [Actinomycetota bacterium]